MKFRFFPYFRFLLFFFSHWSFCGNFNYIFFFSFYFFLNYFYLILFVLFLFTISNFIVVNKFNCVMFFISIFNYFCSVFSIYLIPWIIIIIIIIITNVFYLLLLLLAFYYCFVVIFYHQCSVPSNFCSQINLKIKLIIITMNYN